MTPLVQMDGPSCSGRGVCGGETRLGEEHGRDSENKECTPGMKWTQFCKKKGSS